ncbi:repeat-containing protein [Seminavis robusta]|uniref:Repeat-containing protein n=1 Tax=Seminavis robusta TaxID=568900 RepID=A0A9N8H0K3_9STRA|nr:repeat-containing protein [Seminavis robusta]|eukprot:Sro22_g015180.1 repeat-containing protein (381) ;mRNA; f:32277-33496
MVFGKRFSFKRKSKEGKKAQQSTPKAAPLKPVYYEEAVDSDAQSSDVEFIEDDSQYVPPERGKYQATSKLEESTFTDVELPLAVVVPSKDLDDDDNSILSQDGVFNKVFRPRAEKSSKPRLSLATSTTSDEHLTAATASASEQTFSEAGSLSIASEKFEQKERRKLARWKEAMDAEICRVGMEHPKAAALLLELGSTHLQCEHFEEARNYFTEAVAVSESIFGASDLRLAKAFELLGAAEYTVSKQDKEMLHHSLSCLEKAYLVRYEQQGPEHVDTVSTLSRIGRVQTKLKNYEDARVCHYEVLKIREAIFGSNHPCCAVSARALALVYVKLRQAQSAKFYFKFALKIYQDNGLEHHRFASAIRKDMHDLKIVKKARVEV